MFNAKTASLLAVMALLTPFLAEAGLLRQKTKKEQHSRELDSVPNNSPASDACTTFGYSGGPALNDVFSPFCPSYQLSANQGGVKCATYANVTSFCTKSYSTCSSNCQNFVLQNCALCNTTASYLNLYDIFNVYPAQNLVGTTTPTKLCPSSSLVCYAGSPPGLPGAGMMTVNTYCNNLLLQRMFSYVASPAKQQFQQSLFNTAALSTLVGQCVAYMTGVCGLPNC